MELLDSLPRAGWKVWVAAITGSVLLLGIVLIQLDMTSLRTVADGLLVPVATAGLLLLLVEGVVTAARLSLMAGTHQPFVRALQANAWYSMLVVVIPARLGEIAAVLVMEKYLLQRPAPAFMSIIVQRLFDLIMLGTLFLLVLTSLASQLPPGISGLVACVVIGMALLAVYQMETLITLVARWLIGTRLPISRANRHKILRLLLQGRSWRRHLSSAGLIAAAFSLTVVKWLVTVGAIGTLLMALYYSLGWHSALLAAVAYCFMAAVPLQTIGGIGLGEAGLVFILSGMGVPVGVAAAMSLFVRLVLILFPALFFGLVFIYTVFDRRSQDQEHSIG